MFTGIKLPQLMKQHELEHHKDKLSCLVFCIINNKSLHPINSKKVNLLALTYK